MRRRSLIIFCVVAAVLLSRTAGLHFHFPEIHHDAHQAGAVHDHSDDPPPVTSFGMESGHLQELLEGARDADVSASPVDAKLKIIPMIVFLAFIGMTLVLMLRAGQVPIEVPFQPPRLCNPANFLPPSRAPPAAA